MVETIHPRQRTNSATHIMPDGTCLLFDTVSVATLIPEEKQTRAKILSRPRELGNLGYLPADEETEPGPGTGAEE